MWEAQEAGVEAEAFGGVGFGFVFFVADDGVAEVCEAAYPDPTAWDPTSHYFDPGATPENQRWLRVDVRFVAKAPRFVSLDALKAAPRLEGMYVIRKGMRLSVQPVEPHHFAAVLEMASLPL